MNDNKQVSKKTLIIVGAVIVLAIAFLVGKNIYDHRKESYFKGNPKIVQFEGYDGSGRAEIDNVKAIDHLGDIILKRLGLSDSDMDRASKYVNEHGTLDPSDPNYEKNKKIIDLVQEFKIEIVSPNSKLKNGDEIKVRVSNSGPKDYPIKQETKNIKVTGLKKVVTRPTSDIFSTFKPKFVGFNGHGIFSLDIKNGSYIGKVKVDKKFTNGKLSNGQTITLTAASNDLFEKEGVKYVGSKKVSYKVKGLKDLSKFSNIDEAVKTTDEFINHSDRFKDNKNALIGMYLFQGTAKFKNFRDLTEHSSEVSMTFESSDAEKVNIAAIYKSQKDNDEPKYALVSIKGVGYKKDKLKFYDWDEYDGFTNSKDDLEEIAYINRNQTVYDISKIKGSPEDMEKKLSVDGVKVR